MTEDTQMTMLLIEPLLAAVQRVMDAGVDDPRDPLVGPEDLASLHPRADPGDRTAAARDFLTVVDDPEIVDTILECAFWSEEDIRTFEKRPTGRLVTLTHEGSAEFWLASPLAVSRDDAPRASPSEVAALARGIVDVLQQ